MKIKHERIDVEMRHGLPHSLIRGGRRQTVSRILDRWIYRSRWWGVEEQREYWWIECESSCMEVYVKKGQWYGSRVWD